MATINNRLKGLCDEAFFGLEKVKNEIIELRERLSLDYAGEKDVLAVYERHLGELTDQIDWKLQIMAHACSYDWKGSVEFDDHGANTASVGPAEKEKENFSPGYLGG